MGRYLIGRLISAIPVLLGVLVVVFVFLRLIPGDPVQVFYFGSDAGGQSNTAVSDEVIEQARRAYNLDKSIPEQFVLYVVDVLRGELGRSFRTRQPIVDIIREQMPATLELTFAGMGVALLIGLVAGTLSAVKHHTVVDYASQYFAVLGVSIPSFWLGILLIYLFSVNLGWLPAISTGNGPKQLLMPAISLGVGASAIIARLMRSSMLDVMRHDFVRTARAKGVTESGVVWGHALKNAMIPVLTIVGLQFGALLAGSVVIEVVFTRQGLGFTLVKSISNRDYPVVQALVMLSAFIYVGVNIVVDVLYTYIDPRVRLS